VSSHWQLREAATSLGRLAFFHFAEFDEQLAVALRDAGTIGAYSLVDLQFGLVEKEDKFRLTFIVKNLFDQSFAAQITNGGPGNAFRYLIPREADRYFGITGRINF
jgi:iron complex outermembrane receptor protein